MNNAMKRLMGPTLGRIRRTVMGAVIKAVHDDKKLQQIMVKTLGTAILDNLEVFGQYGITSVPPVGTDAILLDKGGRYIVIATGDRKYRLKNLGTGEVAIYDDKGQYVLMSMAGIKLKDKNKNIIEMKSGQINLNGVIIDTDGNIKTPGTVNTGGDINSGGDVITKSGISLGKHPHPFPYNAGPTPSNGTTSPPQSS